MTDDDLDIAATASMGLDLLADENARARALLFAPDAVELQRQYAGAAPEPEALPVAEGGQVTSAMPLVFRARSVRTASGTFGHLRIFTFHVPEQRAFVDEFVRLLGLLPQEGLILDVRGNGGGHLVASERLLQTLTPRRITPEPVQFICTPLNLEICRRNTDNPTTKVPLGAWLPSMDLAVETGSVYSAPVPLTPEDQANDIGQRYFGPVVLVTDARCYSATDVFAAGFQDHEIGDVLGVDSNTGAGGANVWPHRLLRQLRDTPPDPDTPYAALPKQAGMTVSVRRTLRVGKLAGTPVEDLGVRPTVPHELTRRDVLKGNLDLLEHAGTLLAGRPVRRLEFTAAAAGDGTLALTCGMQGLDRLDVEVDGRPRGSWDVGDGACDLVVAGVPGARSVRVEGFFEGKLVAARTEKV
jgi:hypothetical protein